MREVEEKRGSQVEVGKLVADQRPRRQDERGVN